jgi:aspartate/methionine/tyrosine aminotransferase
MDIERFELDEWLESRRSLPIDYDLAQSYGPSWTVRELLALDGSSADEVLDCRLLYATAEGDERLRTALAEMEGVRASEVQIVTGAQEALAIAFFLAGERGRNVVLPQPGYPPCAALARAFGLEVRPYVLNRNRGFQVDVDEVLHQIDAKTALVLATSPHNPTGSVLGDAEQRALHDACQARGIPFIVDQVYHPMHFGNQPPSAASLPNATVFGDFSKALSLSGLRLGWIVERDRARMQRYRTVRTYFTVSNTPLSERLGTLAVQHRDAILDRGRAVAVANLRVLSEFFAEHSEFFGYAAPTGGFVTFPWLRSGENARPLCQALASAGVFTAPGDCFGAPDHMRIGFGIPSEHFGPALERIASAIASRPLG